MHALQCSEVKWSRILRGGRRFLLVLLFLVFKSSLVVLIFSQFDSISILELLFHVSCSFRGVDAVI